ANSDISAANDEIRRILTSYQADADNPGWFSVRSPEFDPKYVRKREPQWLTINGNDYRSELLDRFVKPSDPLLRLGEISGVWEIEIRIPEKNVGQVRLAYTTDDPEEVIDVDLKLQIDPNSTYRGKLARKKIAPAAVPNKDEHNETEPVV